jgi:hypothetical protein
VGDDAHAAVPAPPRLYRLPAEDIVGSCSVTVNRVRVQPTGETGAGD